MKLILLNGPPRSGKDTAAGFILAEYGPSVAILRMSEPIKSAFAGMMLEYTQYEANSRVHASFEENKDQQHPFLRVSYRQWQIDFSERFMKPRYGNNIFARLFLRNIQGGWCKDADVVVVPDCGFQIEFETLLAAFGPSDISLIRLYRQGYSFAGDSREYIDPSRDQDGTRIPKPPFRCNYTPLSNYNDLETFRRSVLNVVQPFLEPTPCLAPSS